MKKKVITRWDNEPYLIRYTLLDTPLFGVKVHNILLSDDACLHDHPWAFISFILKGGYVEESYDLNAPLPIEEVKDSIEPHNLYPRKKVWYQPFDFLYRPARFAHRLIVKKPAWTFVITFKKVRRWGFFTPQGWIHWKSYKQENSCE